LLSGIITAYLLTQEYLPSDRDYLIAGALSGGIAGLVSGLLYTIIYTIIIVLLSGAMAIPYMNTLGTHHSSLYMGSTIISFILLAIFLITFITILSLIGAAFGTVGSLLYRLVLEINKSS